MNVFAYGFPWGGDEMSLTKGVVSRVEMNGTAHGGGAEVLSCDMDTAIAAGNSGGPVIDGESNKVVGVVFQGYDAKAGGYMIAVDVLKKAVELDDVGETLAVPTCGFRYQKLENKWLRVTYGLENDAEDLLDAEDLSEEEAGVEGGENKKEQDGAGAEDVAAAKDNAENANADGAVEEGAKKEESDSVLANGKLGGGEEKPPTDAGEVVATPATSSAQSLNSDITVFPAPPKPIEGGILINELGENSPFYDILKPHDVLLKVNAYAVGENGTVEIRPGERTRFSHAVSTGKTLGDDVAIEWLRDGTKLMKARVKLDKSASHLYYALVVDYDVRPKYVIKAGLVFSPFCRNLCYSQKGSCLVRPKLRNMMADFRKKDTPSLVLLTKVLQETATAGYETIKYRMVEKINKQSIFTLEDVKTAFESGGTPIGDRGKLKHIVEVDFGEQVVVITDDLEAETKRIAGLYSVTELENLKDKA